MFLDMARDPAIVDLVAALVGPDVILWGCQVFWQARRRRHGGAVAPGRPLLAHPTSGHDDRVDRDRRLHDRERLHARDPGSHTRGLLPHGKAPRGRVVLDLEVDAAVYDESTARDVVLEAGQLPSTTST